MKAGLEVHQQLATGKLFCACPAELSERVLGTLFRRLRATGGELHEIDPAAEFEASLGLAFRYELVPTCCLVETDEEPPHPINAEALDVALTMALLLHAHPVDEIQVMRKIVVDGSNTTGFQRTALVAVDGWIEVGGRRHIISTICLEEDAARKVGEKEGEVRYRLDRLGIPLVEITTAPDIVTPDEVREVAGAIGALFRATRKVRRGIGATREDLNLSVEGGSRIEIKGVQELRLLPKYAEQERMRQRELLEVREELRRRAAAPAPEESRDVTEMLRATAHGRVGSILGSGGVALAVKLPGFAGLLGRSGEPGHRFGRELADQARAVGLGGIIQSDELPADGIGPEVVARLRETLGLGAADAFALVAHRDPAKALRAARRVSHRAALASAGVPPETRDPLPDGSSRYSRPLPGRDRMYPETDIPPVAVRAEHLERLAAHLPETPETTRCRLHDQYGVGLEVVGILVRDGEADRFEALASRGHSPAIVARLLTQDLPSILSEPREERVAEPDDQLLEAVLAAYTSERFAKEGLPKVLEGVLVHRRSVEEAVAAAGLEPMRSEQVEAAIERVLDRNAALLQARGSEAASPLMGDVMREVRGRFDGREVAELLRRALERRLAKKGEAG